MKYQTFSVRLGKQLASIRQDQSMTQAQVARDADLSLKYVSMIEKGTNPSIKTVMKMCQALDTDIASVLEKAGLGARPGRKSSRAVQVDIESEDLLVKKLVKFIKKLKKDDKRRALRLLKTTFGDS